MKYLPIKNLSYLTTATVISLLLCSTKAAAAITASYLYTLSDFTGRIPYTWPGLSIHQERGEIYVVNQGSVVIYNSVGMEVYRFGDDQALGIIIDVATEKDGNILVLSYRWDARGNILSVLRCNYCGELKDDRGAQRIPKEFSPASAESPCLQEREDLSCRFRGIEISWSRIPTEHS